jgi:hypothetical protein
VNSKEREKAMKKYESILPAHTKPGYRGYYPVTSREEWEQVPNLYKVMEWEQVRDPYDKGKLKAVKAVIFDVVHMEPYGISAKVSVHPQEVQKILFCQFDRPECHLYSICGIELEGGHQLHAKWLQDGISGAFRIVAGDQTVATQGGFDGYIPERVKKLEDGTYKFDFVSDNGKTAFYTLGNPFEHIQSKSVEKASGEYKSLLDMFIKKEVPFRIAEIYDLPLTEQIKNDLIFFAQSDTDLMFSYDAFDNQLLDEYKKCVRAACRSYEGVIDYLCASLNKTEGNEFNRKIEEFSPIFESTHYFGIYFYNGDNEYYLVDKKSGSYDLVLDDSPDFIGKNSLSELAGEEILDVANKEFLEYLVEYSREYTKGLIPERELGGLHVLELALRPNDVNLIFEDVKRQLEGEKSCTAFGEPRAWVALDNGRSIEVTLEKEMLSEEDYFYSARLHCTEEECENKDYHSTVGIINSIASASANVDEIKTLLIATLKCNERYPVQEHSKKRSALDDKIAAAEEQRNANENNTNERSAKDEPERT